MRLLTYLLALIAFVLALLPNREGDFGGVIAHCFAFVTIGLTSCLGFRERHPVTIWIVLGIFGAGIELGQALVTTGRDPSLTDIFIDLLAAAAGITLGMSWRLEAATPPPLD